MTRKAFLVVPLALLLMACEDSAQTEGAAVEQGGEAAGDVLGGTISDDMLPLEELKSQSPPVKRAATADAGEVADDEE